MKLAVLMEVDKDFKEEILSDIDEVLKQYESKIIYVHSAECKIRITSIPIKNKLDDEL